MLESWILAETMFISPVCYLKPRHTQHVHINYIRELDSSNWRTQKLIAHLFMLLYYAFLCFLLAWLYAMICCCFLGSYGSWCAFIWQSSDNSAIWKRKRKFFRTHILWIKNAFCVVFLWLSVTCEKLQKRESFYFFLILYFILHFR